MAEPWLLFYDAECAMCHASQLACVRWAQQAGQNLTAFAIESEEGRKLGVGKELTLVAGTTYTGFQAWLVMARFGPWWIRWLPGLRPLHPFANMVYRLVARHRRRFGTRRK